jgi:hypothetical protein
MKTPRNCADQATPHATGEQNLKNKEDGRILRINSSGAYVDLMPIL